VSTSLVLPIRDDLRDLPIFSSFHKVRSSIVRSLDLIIRGLNTPRMHTRRANYHPVSAQEVTGMNKANIQNAERESHDRQESPKRQRIEESSMSPSPGPELNENQSQTTTEDDSSKEETQTNKNATEGRSSLLTEASLEMVDDSDEDELLQRLLSQAEQNSKNHSQNKKIARIT
jgi:hypothetical protein